MPDLDCRLTIITIDDGRIEVVHFLEHLRQGARPGQACDEPGFPQGLLVEPVHCFIHRVTQPAHAWQHAGQPHTDCRQRVVGERLGDSGLFFLCFLLCMHEHAELMRQPRGDGGILCMGLRLVLRHIARG